MKTIALDNCLTGLTNCQTSQLPWCPQEGREVKGSQGFQKKRPIMSKEFISQHTVEHNGRNICKYFLEGRCIKVCLHQSDASIYKFFLEGRCIKVCLHQSDTPIKCFCTNQIHLKGQRANRTSRAGRSMPSWLYDQQLRNMPSRLL